MPVKKQLRHPVTLLLLIVATTLTAFGQCFQPEATYATGSSPYGIVTTDFNGDGKPDLATANLLSSTISVFINNGTGGFGTATSFAVAGLSESLATADFNADGKADLAVSGYESGVVSVLLGNGAGGFAAAVNYSVTVRIRATTVGDVNGDGKLDIITAHNGIGANNGSVSVLPGNGDGTFGTAVGFASGSFSADVAVGDLNGDNKPDLAVANVGGTVSVLLNTGVGAGISFGGATTVYSGGNPLRVVLRDVNADNKLDLVSVSSSNVLVGFGTGSGGFGTFASYTVGGGGGSVAVRDMNGDGKPDLAVSYFNSIQLLLNTGSGLFGPAVSFPVTAGAYIATADFNADSKPDIAITGGANVVSVLLSTTTLAVGITASPSLTICSGASTTLTATGGSTYLWNDGTTTATLSVSVAGTYSVTGTSTSNSCSNTAVATVTVNPVPTFTTSNPTLCPGSYVNLGNYIGNKSPITGDLTYYTTEANAQAGTNALTSGLVGPVTNPTTYYARYDATGCFSIQPITVTFKPASPAPPAQTQSGHAYTGGVASVSVAQNSESVILAVPGCDGSVAWSGPNNFISFSPTISVPTSATGNFTYSASCSSQTACFSGSSQATVTVSNAPPCGLIVYVTPTGAGTQNGSSWTNAFSGTALQTAINTAAGCGAQVWVASGTYKPTTTTDRSISFSMTNGVAIYGGFVGSETTLTQRSAINSVLGNPSSTTLSGDIGAIGNNSDNSYHVISNSGLTTTAVLDGFMITGGNANGSRLDGYGGGTYNNGSGSSGVCSPTVRNCLFTANAAKEGGAMYNDGYQGTSNPVLTNCSFQANIASQQGGAMLNYGYSGTSNPVLTNCSFQANIASQFGGAMYNNGSSGNNNPVLTNCSFQNNAAGSGGAMYNYGIIGNSSPGLTNCVLFGNGGSNTVVNYGGATVTATYSLFEPAATTLTGMNVSGPGNLTATVSPFASTTSVALTGCSPAINAGLNTANTTPTDLAGNQRIFGGQIDMGAIEFQDNPFSVSIAANPSLTITQGQSATLTASGGSGQPANSYSWTSGETTAAISVSVAGPYSVTGIIGSCSSVTTITLTVNAPVCGAGLSGPTWTGCVSTDWNTAGNWASGAVPTATDDVVIPSAPANQPILSTTATAKSVEVQGGASLSIVNTGTLTINGSKSVGGNTTAFYNSGTVINSGQLVMGNTAAIGNFGLNNLSTFTNNAGGTISIDRSGAFGLRNNAGSFTNSGTVSIGAVAAVGQYGLYNLSTFTNHAGGIISIDRTTDYGLFNDGITNTFTNSATITIGAVVTVGTDGINNRAIFSNTGCGGLIRIVSNSIVKNRGTFSNSSTIIENASGNSSISDNTGLVQNLNGGTFTVTTGNQPLSVSATNPTTCTPPNGSLTLNGLQANTTYALSYTVSGNATTASPAPVSDANGQFTIGNLGAGIYTIALSGSCVAQTLFMSATLTGTASPTITTQPAAGSAVCVGGTVSISVNVSGTGPFTYQWYRNGSMVGGQTSAALSLTNGQITDAGSYSVVVSSSCNSATSTAFSLTVNTPPTVSITASPSLTVCQGASVTLTASAGNAGTTYRWNNGQTTQAIVINTNDPSGNPGPGGGYSGPQGPQSVTVTNAAGCSAITTVTLTINPVPTASITPSSQTVCQGQPASLTASGGSIYQWNTGATTAVISVTATGTYSVTVSGTTGPTGATGVTGPGGRIAAVEGCYATASAMVTITPGPTNASLTSGTLSCAQTSVTLTASATGGTSYTLTGGAGSQSNTTGQFVVSQPGTYTVTIANASGCTAMASASVSQDNTMPSVSIAANPSLTITQGQSATLTAQGATSYSWSTGANTPSIIVSAAGPYSVTGTGANGCSSATSVTVSTINTAPVATANANQTATVGMAFAYTVNAFTDAETPNQLTYSAIINPANGLSFDPATRIISGTPSMSGVSSVSITATDPGSLSASTSFSITVSPAFGSGALSVLHQDVSFGQTTTNTILPYLQLVNSGSAPIAYSAITVRYWLTVEGNSPITNFQNYYVQIGGNNVHEQYVPLATPRQGATAYVEYGFDGAAGSLAGGTNSGPIQNGFAKGDYSAFDQSDDYSYVSNRDYVANSHITAYVNGVLVYGQEPPGTGPVLPLSLSLTASPNVLTTSGTTTLSATVSGGTTGAPDRSYSYTFSGPGTISPSGNTASVSGIPAGVQTYTVLVRDATSPTSQTIAGTVSVTVSTSPANTAPVATANASQTATVGVAFAYTVNAFTDAETPNQLTYSASINPANGFSFDPATRIISGTPSMSGVTSVTVTATDPGSLSASTSFSITVSPAPVVVGNAQLTVLYQDVSFGQTTTNTILPYLQLVNSGSAPIAYSAITVRYWLTVEGNSPITNFQNYYVQIGGNNVHERYVPLATPRQGATAYVEYSFDAAAGNLAGGTNSGPIQNGFSKADYSAFNQSDDYSYVPNRDYVANAHITAYVNGVLVYGQEPPVGVRVGATAGEGTLRVQVLGNPVVNEVVEIMVSGAGGQSLLYQLTDGRGQVVSEHRVDQAGSLDHQRLSVVGQSAGVLLLRVSSPTQRQTVKVLKGE